jgi:hypothetical protein
MSIFNGLGAAISGQSFVPQLGQMFQNPTIMEKFGQWAKQNPNQLWMGLDMAGQAFDPNNVAAGVGTKISQANMMGEGQAAKDSEAKGWQDNLSKLMGTPNSPLEQAGPTKKIITQNPNGTYRMSMDFSRNNMNGSPEINIPQPQQSPAGYSLSGQSPNPTWPRQ